MQARDPLRQRPAIALECTKLPMLDTYTAVRLFDQRTRRDLGLMDIQADHALEQCYQFHATSG